MKERVNIHLITGSLICGKFTESKLFPVHPAWSAKAHLSRFFLPPFHRVVAPINLRHDNFNKFVYDLLGTWDSFVNYTVQMCLNVLIGTFVCEM